MASKQYKSMFTPIGTVEPYAALAAPDFGRDHFKSERGKYKVSLTLPVDVATPLMDLIDEAHRENYAELLADYKDNPPKPVRGKKALEPYEGEMPYVDNGDGTVTFKFASWADYKDKKTGETLPLSPKIVDSRGKKIVNVPRISGGSEGKVKFKLFPYPWNTTVGASVKLQLEGFMLTKLVEFGDDGSEWADEAVEDGFVADGSEAAQGKRAQAEPDYGSDEDEFGDDPQDF